jgi:probable addiction module antidote protein
MKTKSYRTALLKRLKDPQYAVGYLTDVLSEEAPEAFLIALRDVIDARGENISALTEEAQITRQTFYQAFTEGGNPRLSTICRTLAALGLRLSVRQREAA